MLRFIHGLSSHTRERLGLALLLGLAALLMVLMNNPYLTVVNIDSAIFCLLGKALAQGQGYALLSEPNPSPYFTFPPLLPVQLAVLMKLSGTTDLQALQSVLKGYTQLLFLFSLPLFYAWLRRGSLGGGLALALTGLLAVNPLMFKYSTDVLSDVPYWFFAMASLWSAAQWQSLRQQDDKTAVRFFVLTLLCIACAALTRQIGLALVLAFWGFLALRRQWKALLVSLVVLGLAASAWQVSEHVYRSQHAVTAETLNQAGVGNVLKSSPVKLEFVKHFLVVDPVSQDRQHVQQGPQELLHNMQTRLERYSEITLDQLFPPLSVRLAGQKQNLFHLFPFLVGLWLVFLVGFKVFYRTFPLPGLYLLCYAGILLVYPYISPRFLLPLFPLILVSLVMGLQQAQAWLRAQPKPVLQRVAVAVVPVFLLLVFLGGHVPQTLRWVKAGYQLKQAQVGPSLRAGNQGYYRTVVWIKDHVPADSLVISRKPPVTYFYSQRKSLAFPFTRDPQRLLAYLQQQQNKSLYVLQDTAFQESLRYLAPLFSAYPKHFRLVYQEPISKAKVWQFVP